MKTLIILRHAKSSWADVGAADFDRPLNKRGRGAAEAVARELKARLPAIDAVLASPAARVRETLDRLQATYGALPPVRFEQSLYLAEPDAIMRLVQTLANELQTALVVGHNPGLHSLVLALSEPNDRLRAELVTNLPTGAAAVLELPVTEWSDVRLGTAGIAALILPRNLP